MAWRQLDEAAREARREARRARKAGKPPLAEGERDQPPPG
jgi:hypothetical protein